MNTRSLLSGLVLALPPLFWAGNFVVGRAANADVPPLMLALSRHVVALAFLLPFGWSIMRRDLPRYWAHRWQILKVSLSGMVTFNALVYVGLHSTTASNAQLLNSTIPVLIVLFGAIFLRQRLAAMQVFGLVLSCLGVLIIILHGDMSRLATLQFSTGDLIVFAAMASFSLFSVWLRDFPADLNRVGLLGVQFVIAIAALTPLAGVEFLAGARPLGSTAGLAAMLYVGIAAGLSANLLYMFGIARVGPARAGLFIHLVPLYGAFMSSVFLGESLQRFHVFGMAAVIAGLALSQQGGAPMPDMQPPEIKIVSGYRTGLIARITQMHAHYYASAAGFGRAFEVVVAGGLAAFSDRLDNPGNAILAAMRGDKILGSIAIDGEDLGDGLAHLRWFIVDDALRGTGQGKRLLDSALAFADAQGFAETHLWTFTGLDAARHLYETAGFVLAGESPGSQWGKEVIEQHFIRLRPST